jgi:hypothetical protein
MRGLATLGRHALVTGGQNARGRHRGRRGRAARRRLLFPSGAWGVLRPSARYEPHAVDAELLKGAPEEDETVQLTASSSFLPAASSSMPATSSRFLPIAASGACQERAVEVAVVAWDGSRDVAGTRGRGRR